MRRDERETQTTSQTVRGEPGERGVGKSPSFCFPLGLVVGFVGVMSMCSHIDPEGTEPWGPAGVRLVGERCTPWAPPP